MTAKLVIINEFKHVLILITVWHNDLLNDYLIINYNNGIKPPVTLYLNATIDNPRADVTHHTVGTVVLRNQSAMQTINYDTTSVQPGDCMDAEARTMIPEEDFTFLKKIHPSVHVEAHVEQMQQRSIPTHGFSTCEEYPPTIFF